MKNVMVVISLLALFSSVWAQQILSLNDAIEIAKENSPDIQRSQYNLERSQESLNAQKAALKSRFTLTVNPFGFSNTRQFNNFFNTWNTNETKYSSGDFRVVQPLVWTDGSVSLINRFRWQDSFSEYQNERNKTFSNDLFLNYNQPIFTYNRTKLALKELELDLENSSLSYSIQNLNLEYQVTQTFYDVYAQKLGHQIAIEELNNGEQSYSIIKNKVEAGLSAKEELYQSELTLANSRSKVQNEKVALEFALDNFKRLAGISIAEEIDVTADVSHQPIEVDLQRAIDTGLVKRMEIRQSTIEVENAYTNLVQTMALNEFKGEVNLTYGLIGTDEVFEQMYNQPTKNQVVQLSFEIPLFDWGEKQSRLKASEAILKSRKLTLETDKIDIVIEIRQAYRSLQNLEIQVEIAQQSIKNAQLTYDINLERYENGDLTSMDLNLFQIQLSEQKIGLVTALINYKLALLDLKIKAMWDFQTNRAVLKTVGR
jgi:outer membrane protein